MKLKKIILTFMVLVSGMVSMNGQVWKDPKASVEDRVDDLLSKMTLEEKISYCGSRIPAIERLGIPYFEWYGEALHGLKAWNCTQFPQNIAMGATWNPDLMFDVATAISNEARALKNKGQKEVMMFSPTVNMARDPRWGRNEECYSEDPHLMSEIARMYVRGMQGNDPNYVKTVTTVKHYVANNVDKRREFSHSLVRDVDLYEYYFPAYKTCIVDEEATGIMTGLNGVNGVPCSAHNELVNGVLREQWGFEGYVIADWAAVQGIEKRMRFAKTQEEAAAMAIKAGVDQECFRHKTKEAPFVTALKPAIEQGLLTEAELDVSVKRLLRLRFMTGDFDDPSLIPYSKIPESVLECDTHKQLALKAAEQSIVLLKNDAVLPLKKDIDNLAVIGPFANRCWLGIYSGNPKSKISPLEGIKKSVSGEVSFAEGCTVTGAKDDQKKIDEAVALAKKSDTVILVVGNDESTATETLDRTSLKLPGKQHELIKAVQAVNKNVVLVLVPSGSTSIGWEQENLPGIICAWPNGQEQGTALANVLFGDVNPGGKLSTSWVKSEKDLPHFHDYNVTTWKDDYGPEVGRTYMYAEKEPLYPFGFGLSYTQFEIKNMKLNRKKVKDGQDITVTATVKNVGEMDGDEIVQIYVRDTKANHIVATKALKGFKRIHVPAGKSKTVTIKLPYEAFSYYDVSAKTFKVEAGDFEILIGQSSEKIVASKSIPVEAGVIPEIKVGQKSGYFNAKDENRSKKWDYLYKNEAFTSHKSNEDEDENLDWIEYEIVFIDPGVYVSYWDAELNFEDASKEAIIVASMEGVEIGTYTILNNQRKLPISIPIPPEYGKPVRLKIKTVNGEVKHKSIKIIPPGNKEPFIITKVVNKSK
ncbi:glycoside hydrolase family 3 C-terminal domain-containing protein [Tamlana sp. 2_MG-2023]|uniref:glycoside hydrolase family 3 C-terminal domain-containing protein n=1 Tax=unclassified Tamlana TaxID=2614803 RepID=UPI0026E2528E|nr:MULTISPECIES: glycoside hydrolase family 3 C-terminal domain-containing protein [unclassified Tamlana]MDO6760450.1 glycoside hydrolase family 3 C-terminal domain-containing protein [Tamlana sp. 2_MG-2023]MDO6790706.1 glycoside hydrolase family 3 C-terminal domain-containing protein [Tamlana sp. 1_MG-2023]